MFRDKFQQQRLSILYACGAAPLELWDMQVKNGNIRRVVDEEVNSLALEIIGTNVSTTYIFSPKNPRGALGICLPFFIMIIKNMKRYFTFEITILDDQNMHRRFRASNFQSATRIRPFGIIMPICLSPGWNQIQFNLAEFTRRAYGTNYVETTRMQIHANCRIRRVYFSDRLYTDDELPDDYRLFFPSSKPDKKEGGSKEGSKMSMGRVSRVSRISRDYDDEEYKDIYGEESLGPSRSLVTPEEPTRLRIDVPLGQYEEDTDEATERESDVDTERRIEGELSEGSVPLGDVENSYDVEGQNGIGSNDQEEVELMDNEIKRSGENETHEPDDNEEDEQSMIIDEI